MKQLLSMFTKNSVPDPRNIVLTGPPCAGKTLSVWLLNKLPDVAALSEPFWKSQFTDRQTGLKETALTFSRTRQSILSEKTAITKLEPSFFRWQEAGLSQQNPIATKLIRKSIWNVRFDKPFSDDFTLVIENSLGFMAILPDLTDRYRCFAVVRNPLSILFCWNAERWRRPRTNFTIAEILDPRLKKRQTGLKNSLESQIGILSWCFERCLALPRVSVIRYEDIIAGGGAALAPLAPLASNLSEKFLSRDSSNFEIAPLFQELGEKLLRSNGAFWEFYSKESVEALLSRHTQVAS
jgi:hypothetical protein